MAPKPKRPAPADFYQPASYTPEESAAFLMKQILASMSAEVDHALTPQGLTHAQWIPLLKIHWGHASTAAELAREIQLDAGATTRLLDRLEAKGLVRRERSTEDRRVVKLALTPEGAAAARKIPAVLCKVQNAHLAGFDAGEWLQLKTLLRRVLENARALQADRQGQA